MQVEVSLSPALYPFRTLRENHVTVAIDVLRATTAVCAAFQAGCREVVPLDSLEALEPYRAQGYAVAAERGGRKLPGSDYGNSPTEYLGCDMSGVRLAYSTTNGTVSILRAADAALTLVGSFANLDALCNRLLSPQQEETLSQQEGCLSVPSRQENGFSQQEECLSVPSLREGCPSGRGGGKEAKDIVLLCSGWQNDFCIEDTLLTGAIIEKLAPKVSMLGDAAHMALDLWHLAKDDPYAFCQKASHVHRLEGFGPQAQADIEFAFKRNTCPVVPVLKKGVLTL